MLLFCLRGQSKIVLVVASSGIASLLLLGGKTAHSGFNLILINLHDESTYNITQQMKVAKLVCKVDLIIWDEAPMMHCWAFEIVDRTLRDLMQLDDTLATEKIFGGKTMVLGGDFQQIMHVVLKGGQEDIINVLLLQSHLWQHVTILCLHINMQIIVLILKSNESLPNGCWVLETVVFLPLQKKKVLIQIGSRFRPIWSCQQKITA